MVQGIGQKLPRAFEVGRIMAQTTRKRKTHTHTHTHTHKASALLTFWGLGKEYWLKTLKTTQNAFGGSSREYRGYPPLMDLAMVGCYVSRTFGFAFLDPGFRV